MSNVGTLDRIFRFAVGAFLAVAPFLTGWPVWTSAVALWASVIVGVVLIATSMFSFCPIYAVLGLSSKRKHKT
ncbi:MAG: DUF2892 domain-containing protein [Devosia sp.]